MSGFTKEMVVKALETFLSEGEIVRATKKFSTSPISGVPYYNNAKFFAWKGKILTALDSFGIKNEQYNTIVKIGAKHGANRTDISSVEISAVQEQVKGIIELISMGIIAFDYVEEENVLNKLATLFARFHKIAKQLTVRHSSRETLSINDEYDVQDLLHSLLLLHFDDIRQEEWTPSYAGGAVRMDFLLKKEKVIIEVKKTRKSMTQKELGEQLIIDINKYQNHPDCEQIYCFIYDPDGFLQNPHAIIYDLENNYCNQVKIFINPIF